MKLARTSALILLLGFGPVGCDGSDTPEVPSDLELENLLRTSLAEEFAPGREIVVSHVELPPDTTMRWHWHPGEEFHYYLEGEVRIEIEGEPVRYFEEGGAAEQ